MNQRTEPQRIDVTALKPEERVQLATLLYKAKYRVNEATRKVPNGTKNKITYFVEYDEMKPT